MTLKGRIFVWVQFACLGLIIINPLAVLNDPIVICGAGLIAVVGWAILFAAYVRLRESLTIYPEPLENVPFVQAGIYKYIRHPMYLGVILFSLAMCLARTHWLSWIFFVVLVIDLHFKHSYEDKLLALKWPGALEYQEKVGALIPKFVVRK